MEHIICKHLLVHCENCSLLTALQHGFHSGLSCEAQLLVTIQNILQAYDDKHKVGVTILDFSKAFDTMPHECLRSKLEHYGIRCPILDWIRKFFTNRKQREVINGEPPTSVHVDSGVPQGMVLEPLLFLLFINDLPLQVKSQVCLFTDDALLCRCINSVEDQVQLHNDLISLE